MLLRHSVPPLGNEDVGLARLGVVPVGAEDKGLAVG